MIKQVIILFIFLTLTLTSMVAQNAPNQVDTEGKRHGKWRKDLDGTTQPKYEGVFNHGKKMGVLP